MKPVVLVVAGFDPSGGAGILRDVRAVESLGARARAVVTAITAQDEYRFSGFHTVDAASVNAQVRVAAGSAPPAAVKIGMLGSRDNCEAMATFLEGLGGSAAVVLDPVLRASTGAELIDDSALDALRDVLLPLATLVTPNVPEAEVLTGATIRGPGDMIAAARDLLESGVGAVLLKGGHMDTDPVVDVLVRRGEKTLRMEHPRQHGGIHGSGCLLSSTVAAHLALGQGLEDAVRQGVNVVVEEIRRNPLR